MNDKETTGGSVKQSKLAIIPCSLKEANYFVEQHHRHHKPVTGHKFSIAIIDEKCKIRGVAIIGRPVARFNDDGWTLEVNRVATDGCKNACSALYAAAWRAARAMGYRKLITYTLIREPGISIRAAGWKCVGQTNGGSWDCPSRPRIDTHPTEPKLRWEVKQ